MQNWPTVPLQLVDNQSISSEKRAADFFEMIDRRRSVRDFSDQKIERETIEKILLAASSAPSGAHKQPWTFVAVADPVLKSQIRAAAEAEERENYTGRMSDEWLRDLAPLGTDAEKPFLEIAPWLIVVFRKSWDVAPDGSHRKNYYVQESVGIACGFLLAAIHAAGLVALTHTPSPMNFLQKILERPENERPFLLVPVGYPAANCRVPDLRRKSADEVIVWRD